MRHKMFIGMIGEPSRTNSCFNDSTALCGFSFVTVTGMLLMTDFTVPFTRTSKDFFFCSFHLLGEKV